MTNKLKTKLPKNVQILHGKYLIMHGIQSGVVYVTSKHEIRGHIPLEFTLDVTRVGWMDYHDVIDDFKEFYQAALDYVDSDKDYNGPITIFINDSLTQAIQENLMDKAEWIIENQC